MAVAFLTLFVAIAGTAGADHLIEGGDIKNNSITTRDVKNRSLLRRDFRPGQLPAGPRGPAGPAGPAGPPGTAGVSGLTYAGDSAPLTAAGTDNDEVYVVAVCPAGRYPVGGDAYAVESNPSDPENPVDPTVDIAEGFTVSVSGNVPSGWFGRATNPGPKAYTLFVDAICSNADPAPAPLSAPAIQGRREALTGGRAR
jgi:hypothetical protein